jgi:hypothetical protein
MAQQEEEFAFIVEDLYKIGGIGWVPCGTVKSGHFNRGVGEEAEFQVKRTGVLLVSTDYNFHGLEQSYGVGESFGTSMKMNKGDVIEGDELVLKRTRRLDLLSASMYGGR